MCNLSTFVSQRMKMTSVYQPVIIRSILKGETSLTSIAQELSILLHGDNSMTCHYLKKLKIHPNKVLTSHGIATIVPRSGQFTLLDNGSINAEQAIQLCTDKINEFLKK